MVKKKLHLTASDEEMNEADKRSAGRRKPRAPTEIEVDVLDFTAACAGVAKALRASGQLKDGREVTTFPWARFIGTDGVHILSCEGVGEGPVTERSAVLGAEGEAIGGCPIPFYKSGGGKVGGASFEVVYSPAQLRALPVLRRENLATFIRVFGGRLESNYRIWKRELERAAP